MPRAVKGLLIECDPSIKSMILKYDEESHDYIVEDLDDENHLVIKESQLQKLKYLLDRVRPLMRSAILLFRYGLGHSGFTLPLQNTNIWQDLDEKIMQLDESESE
ncbi:hypothetical protein N7462_002187 [Penicillium macrosclerotiorum]|uniref:uncharacterized protein n=1 Tax=Penicillium macrosclerotiorum TaxID=303699 RepID=UPI002547395C|nr:uncharacterized protein N7462_002187 [Penicillium macrosclerotiorum]KAJ5692764.1 hypothetical protein N7462_002187 [Penicillium macrosclerotiorum]